jgi:hypothetical protein
MRRRVIVLFAAAACLAIGTLSPVNAGAAAPAWTLTMTPEPANFAPGATPEYVIVATNVGAAATSGQSELKVTLPKAWTIVAYGAVNSDPGPAIDPVCTPATPTLTCETSESFSPGRVLRAQVRVEVPPGAPKEVLEAEASISGGGASQEIAVTTPTPVQGEAVPFGFLPGFNSPLTDESGGPTALAGSHPHQQTVSFGFPTKNPGDGLTNDGHPRNFSVELPRGMVGAPAATPVLCTETELTGEGCPDGSQVGLAGITSVAGEIGNPDIFTSPLYNMVPPPGSPAELATNVAEIGVFVHILAGVRSDGDYGIEATTRDAIAFGQQPIFNVQAQLWGSPTAESHDQIRGDCLKIPGSCPPGERSKVAFLTTPLECSGVPPLFEVLADSWEKPSPEFDEQATSYEGADLAGAPAPVEGCSDLAFAPSLLARPSTNVTDASSGLDVDLHQPQEGRIDGRSTAALKDAAIVFPAGLTVNPAQAAGLSACAEGQIGFEEEGPEGELFFSKAPQLCPDAAKLGTAEVTSPLLVQRNEAHEVAHDPEGNPLPDPLRGAIYLARPFANPFGSLVAIYLVIEDAKTGIVAKLAGEAQLDPQTGQIAAYFEENPELPVEDVRVHLFGGARGTLITPPTCGKFTTEADLTPWSSPEGDDALLKDGFETTTAPAGRRCPTSEAQMPNTFKLSAGAASPSAGAYSPLLFKLSREDGTQRLSRLETTLPIGLSAKLAGVAQCPEVDIQKARSREVPDQGVLEQVDPSCPATSEVGVVNAGAGAGPRPYYTQGHAYLAGPYKGAPFSLVAIAPAVAGPFDLGTVVIRSAIYLDSTTAQARVVSDPLPTILDGVPIDLRSVSVRAERPNFSLNPTSCAEKSFTGSAISSLGQSAPLFERFQVGGCKALPYKPRMSVRLFGPTHRGGHPRLRAIFTTKPGEANTARVSFTFPRSEFIDQAHFRTICTRVQFAANQCPAGSVYGHVKAITPLLDYPLEGPAYLRSSNHKLPDLVVALRGPPAQPIAIDAAGRVDSINGGLRVRFEEVPDAPVSKLIVTAQGAKKGLFQNSTGICKGTFRANLKLSGQNGKTSDTKPIVKADCPKGNGAKKHLHHK